MRKRVRTLGADISGATSIEMAGVAVVSVVAVLFVAKSIGPKVSAAFAQPLAGAFQTGHSSATVPPSVPPEWRRACRPGGQDLDRPECRMR
jgi:Flp pilus assembly pilin Flp